MSDLLSFLIAAALAIVLYAQMDVRVKKEEDLTKICSVSVLGVIPELNDSNKRPVARK